MTAESRVGPEWEDRDTLTLVTIICQPSLARSITLNTENKSRGDTDALLLQKRLLLLHIVPVTLWQNEVSKFKQ